MGNLSYDRAVEACTALDRRLCREDEWEHACRGRRGSPYPYGKGFDDGACNTRHDGDPALVKAWDFPKTQPRQKPGKHR